MKHLILSSMVLAASTAIAATPGYVETYSVKVEMKNGQTNEFTFDDIKQMSFAKTVTRTPAEETTFEALRNQLTAAGKTTLGYNYIMCQVISDPANSNLDVNPHLTWNTTDMTPNDSTAYVQSMDGKYGFRLKLTGNTAPTLLSRYATVKLLVENLEMEREDNPGRYTLHGVTTKNILEVKAGTAESLPVKTISDFSQLTDNDVYTYVTFNDVELASHFGAWGNIHDRFTFESTVVPDGQATVPSQSRCDALPRFFLDKKGNMVPMAINAQVKWRRNGFVPKGSGSVKAIVVGTPLQHYNLNNETTGYSFRVMDAAEISLNATSSISDIVAQWQWMKGKTDIKFKDGGKVADGVLPSIGSGLMTTSVTNADLCDGTTTTFLYANYRPKGAASEYLAFRYNGKWWNTTTETGESVSWSFPTSGVTGSGLTFSMVASSGKQSAPNNGCPIDWKMEYSVDGGETFTHLKNFVVYPAPIFAYEGMDCPGGNAEYVFNLPADALDKDNVIVRMTAISNDYTATVKGLRTGKITAGSAGDAASYLRFEHITIRANK